jgi:hypothetical protein
MTGSLKTRRDFIESAAAMVALLAPNVSREAFAQVPAEPLQATNLFQNVRIFNRKALSAPSNVLVRGNLIETISGAPIPPDPRAGSLLIEGDGRTLMPG